MRHLKSVLFVMGMLVSAGLFCACSSDDESDAMYQIKYYSQPPYADIEQGYWYKETTEDEFIKLTPNTEAPYQLLVCPKNDKGRRAIEYMAGKGDGIIKNVYKRASYFDMNFTDSTTYYLITSTIYFESPDLFVSDNYFLPGYGAIAGDCYRITPTIIVNLKEGADIKDIEAEYNNVMTLRHTNSVKDNRYTTYIFYSHLNNSYEVLRLANELYKRDDVNWAEPDMLTPIHPF